MTATVRKGRTSRVENPVEVAAMLTKIKDHNGLRRLVAPKEGLSYFTVKKLRDKGYVKLEETEKTAVKGRNPFLYVVTKKGDNLLERVNAPKTDKPAKAKVAKATPMTDAERKARKNERQRAARAAAKQQAAA